MRFCLILFPAVAVVWMLFTNLEQPPVWSDFELEAIQSLSLGELEQPPPDPTNLFSGSLRAAQFGHKLFFDKQLSITGGVSCASCHLPDQNFRDLLPKAMAIGEAERRTPSIIGGAYSPWQYWDGRKDSQWSQALAPLERSLEHGGNRTFYARYVLDNYKDEYEVIFGSAPDISNIDRFPMHAGPVENPDWNFSWQKMASKDQDIINRIFVNIGKAIAAYERRLLPGPTRFDNYAEALSRGEESSEFSYDEVEGLRLFIGRANCIDCHNGPLLTNNEFHNTGILSAGGEIPDKGRVQGIRDLLADPFNCFSKYSDAPHNCSELNFALTGPTLIGAFKTPSLRTLKPPFMHKGQLATLNDVVRHYNEAPPSMIGHNEAKPLKLTLHELTQLEKFLMTLEALQAAESKWFKAP